jgi:hypothetical protein
LLLRVCLMLPGCLLLAWLLPQHHPIFLERLGHLDGKRMEREGASDDIILAYHLREMEFMSQVGLLISSCGSTRTAEAAAGVGQQATL